MKISWTSLSLPIAGAVWAGAVVSMDAWEGLRAAILPAISIVAAAVLVRLARGLPFTNADHFSLNDFRAVSDMMEQNAHKLRALIFVCFLTMVGLIVFPGASTLGLFPVLAHFEWMPGIIDRSLSALLGASIVYSFARVIEVVHSDVALIKLQGKIIATVIANKNAKAFEKQIDANPKPGIAGSSGYGRVIQ